MLLSLNAPGEHSWHWVEPGEEVKLPGAQGVHPPTTTTRVALVVVLPNPAVDVDVDVDVVATLCASSWAVPAGHCWQGVPGTL